MIERLASGGDHQHLAVRRPAPDPRRIVTPEREPAAVTTVQAGHVHLGWAVAAAGPGDHAAVPGQPGPAGPGPVGGQPPGPAAGASQTSSSAMKVSRSPWRCGKRRYPSEVTGTC